MRKTGEKVVSLLLALTFIFSGVSVFSANAAGYNPDAAIAYAKSHWNDGVGVCDQFVKACLKAGGVTITAGGVKNVKNALVNGGYGTLYKLTPSGNLYKFSDNSGKVSKGDPLFFVCTTCGGVSSSSAWPHVALCGEGTGGYITDYAHNSAHDGSSHKLWKDLGNSSHPGHTMEVYAFHMNTSSTPITPPTPNYYNPEGVLDILEGRTGGIYIRGWVFDRDIPYISNDIHVYIGGDAASGEGHVLNACTYRYDVDSVYGLGAYHGYDFFVPTNLSGYQSVYVYGINLEGGSNVIIGQGTVYITPDTTPPTIIEYGIIETGSEGYTVYCFFEDNVGVTRVQFPTWTPWQGGNNGQDDLIWYEGNFNPDGKSAWARVLKSHHNNELGYYITHVYVWDAAGNCSQVAMGITVEENAPVISDIKFSNIDTTGYTISCTVADENAISSVKFPAWPGNVVWHEGVLNGQTASCRISVSDHDNLNGCYYSTHIYAYDIWGNVGAINAGSVYVPSASELYTITYNANGGTGAPESNSDYVNVTLSTTIPTKNNYIFLGWATSADATMAQYQPGETISPGKSLTLYAIWEQNTFTLTYNPNGGSNPPANQTGNGTITLSNTVPAREGYTFLGWATSASATTAQYQLGDTFNLTRDITLYAVWEQLISPELTIKEGSGAYLDEDNGIIFGVEANLTEAQLLDRFIGVQGGNIEVSASSRRMGTGTWITLLDALGNEVSSYLLVVFGDIDGNGIINSSDIVAANEGLAYGFEQDCFKTAANVSMTRRNDRFNATDVAALLEMFQNTGVDQTEIADTLAYYSGLV